jgi:hypothetical protein
MVSKKLIKALILLTTLSSSILTQTTKEVSLNKHPQRPQPEILRDENIFNRLLLSIFDIYIPNSLESALFHKFGKELTAQILPLKTEGNTKVAIFGLNSPNLFSSMLDSISLELNRIFDFFAEFQKSP